MAWSSPVYDRTATDVTNKTVKGYFNLADYNRITANTTFLKDLVLSLYGWTATLNTVPSGSQSLMPTSTNINNMVLNLAVVWTASKLDYTFTALKSDYQPGYGRENPTWSTVNDWEKRLYDMRITMVASGKAQTMCGVGTAGQSTTWQRRWRINPAVAGL